MNLYKITTRVGSDVHKTFVVQAYDEEDARQLADRLLMGYNEQILGDDVRDVTDMCPDGMTFQEYVDRKAEYNDNFEFLFCTGGSTPSVVWPSWHVNNRNA